MTSCRFNPQDIIKQMKFATDARIPANIAEKPICRESMSRRTRIINDIVQEIEWIKVNRIIFITYDG